MIGDRVKAQREARGWTQEHLADAAGIAVRTVQRLESNHTHSAETLLAIGAAFGLDVRELTRARPTSPGEHRPLWGGPAPSTAGRIAACLVAPGVLFVAVNLLRYGAGIAGPYELFAGIGARYDLKDTFDALSSTVLLLFPVLAFLLSALTSIRPTGLAEQGAVTVTGVEVRWNWLSFVSGAAAVGVLGLLTLYIVGEKLAQIAQAAG